MPLQLASRRHLKVLLNRAAITTIMVLISTNILAFMMIPRMLVDRTTYAPSDIPQDFAFLLFPTSSSRVSDSCRNDSGANDVLLDRAVVATIREIRDSCIGPIADSGTRYVRFGNLSFWPDTNRHKEMVARWVETLPRQGYTSGAWKGSALESGEKAIRIRIADDKRMRAVVYEYRVRDQAILSARREIQDGMRWAVANLFFLVTSVIVAAVLLTMQYRSALTSRGRGLRRSP